MKWAVTGIDPRKPAKDKGRVISQTIVAADMAKAVAIFYGRFPNVTQLAIVKEPWYETSS